MYYVASRYHEIEYKLYTNYSHVSSNGNPSVSSVDYAEEYQFEVTHVTLENAFG